MVVYIIHSTHAQNSRRVWGKSTPKKSVKRALQMARRANNDISGFESYVLELQQGIRRDAEALETSLGSPSTTFRETR
jgi:hypothetical protein